LKKTKHFFKLTSSIYRSKSANVADSTLNRTSSILGRSALFSKLS
jgi:hypothetical protein